MNFDKEKYDTWLSNAQDMIDSPPEKGVNCDGLGNAVFYEDSGGSTSVKWNGRYVTSASDSRGLLSRMEIYFRDKYTNDDGRPDYGRIYQIFECLFGDDE